MHWTTTTSLAAAAVAYSFTVAAEAAEPVLSKRGFSLTLERGKPRTRTIYRRSESGDAEIEAVYQGTDWVTSMTIGGQVLRAQVDTGSADLWFASTLLPEDYIQANLSENVLYDPTKSPSWKRVNGEIFNISYDVGELGASGIVGTETVELGGATVTGMPIGVATQLLGEGIIDTIYDGTLGLGWGKIQNTIQTTGGTPKPGPTFMEALQPQLDKPVFTADFRANSPETLSFGFINSSLYTGSLSTVPIDNSEGYWGINNITFSSGSTPLGDEGITSIMDTGGTSTTVSQSIAAAYWALVPSSNLDSRSSTWFFPCSTSSLPDLTFNFPGGSSATIAGSVLNVSAVETGDGLCLGGLQGTANGIANAGYGFFGTYFTVFDQGEQQFSFAPYSNVADTAGVNDANLPTATDEPGVPVQTGTSGSGTSGSGTGTGTGTSGSHTTSSSHGAAMATKPPTLGLSVGAGAALLAGLAML